MNRRSFFGALATPFIALLGFQQRQHLDVRRLFLHTDAYAGRTMRYGGKSYAIVTYNGYTFDGSFQVDVPGKCVLDRNGNHIATEYTARRT